ncbi:hypothetical protein [Apilactobacillus apinorum]|uniref:Uncharacterized protein n=1 Tax=Apilactobacillus apinorum TaxID=1218495 RepID=A0ABP9ZI13_9LACO
MKFKVRVLLGIILLALGMNSGMAVVHADADSNDDKVPSLLSKLALDYEQELDNQIQAHTNNTIAEGEKFVNMVPTNDSFVGDDQIADWQKYCTELGLSINDYQGLLSEENELRESIKKDFKAAKDTDDIITSYRDIDNVISSVLDYVHNKKLLLRQLSQQLVKVDADQHVDGLSDLGEAMLSKQAKNAFQNHDESFAGTTLSSRHQYQLATLLDAMKTVTPEHEPQQDADANHSSDEHIDNRSSDNNNQSVDDELTKQITQQQVRINALEVTITGLNQQMNALKETIQNIQNDGFGPIVYDQTGLISKSERAALDQLMDVIRQNTTGDDTRKVQSKHKHQTVKQRLRKVNRQLKQKHLNHRKRVKLLKLRRQLLKRLRHK